jgi:hypothetical protein
MAISRSNGVTRRRARKAGLDNVDGNRIIIDGPKIVRRLKGAYVKKGAALTKNDLKQEEIAPSDDTESSTQDLPEVESVTVTDSNTKKEPKVMERVKIALSGDVIFTPYTDGTQYACRRDALANLRRRMPSFEVMLSDVTGEGQIDFTLSNEFDIEGEEVALTARGLASPYEMAIHTITINYKDKKFDVNPVDRARSPEDTVNFLKRVAVNCVNGVYA